MLLEFVFFRFADESFKVAAVSAYFLIPALQSTQSNASLFVASYSVFSLQFPFETMINANAAEAKNGNDVEFDLFLIFCVQSEYTRFER